MYTVRELILRVNQTHALYFFFSIEAMDRLQARDENPLHWTFLTFTCIKAVAPTGVNSVMTPVVS